MAGNYTQDDPILGTADFDDVYVTDSWLIDQFVGSKLFMWGQNSNGVLGDGTTNSTSSPVQVGSSSNWKQLCCGDTSVLAVKTDGTLWAWGSNSYGQLGIGNTTSYSSPVQVGSLTTWKQISIAQNSVLAVKTDGTVWAWGNSNYGQLGNSSYGVSYSSPIQIGSLTNWKYVRVGWVFTAALKADGTLWAWGNNIAGELGNGTTTNYSSPIQVGSLTNWKFIAPGGNQIAAIKTDGTLWTWGANGFGELGLGDTTARSTPVQVGTLNDWVDVCFTINSGNGNTCAAIKNNGSLWTWGTGAFQELYGGGNRSSPLQVSGSYDWKSLNTGQVDFQIAVKIDGSLWSWGAGFGGGLGTGSTTNGIGQIGTNKNWKMSSKSTLTQFAGALTYADF